MAATLAALALSLLPATASAKPVHVVVGLDLSKSNPLVDDDAYARKVADYVEDYVIDAELKSQVTLRSFGSYNTSDRNLRQDYVISTRQPADAVSVITREIIAGIPKLVAAGRLTAQNNTNILAFLENMAERVDCRSHEVVMILVTDGIEDSEYARMVRQGATLPEPEEALYQGCDELHILGLGQGQTSPELTKRLREQWTLWAEKAGFEEFYGLNDW
ncbi:MAG: VWA domain-containing protein [Alphaproteobacteria bacterium]|nr:VWA domain-containing protein [Alphaproteobacteria bacterium]